MTTKIQVYLAEGSYFAALRLQQFKSSFIRLIKFIMIRYVEAARIIRS